MERGQIGVGLAGLTLTAAVFAQSRCSWAVYALLAATGLILIGTGAHRLPLLHRLPLVGAPTARVELSGMIPLTQG